MTKRDATYCASLLKSASLGKAAVLVAVLVAWQFLAGETQRYILPSPGAVAFALYKMLTLQTLPKLPEALGLTLFEISAAFVMAASLGVAVALLLSYNKMLRTAYVPIVLLIFTIPHIILLPVAFVVFGLGSLSKIAYAALAGFPVITFGVMTAISQVSRSTVDVARSMGARSYSLFTKVILPASISNLVATLRIGLGLIIITTIVAEMVGSLDGLGYYLRTEAENFQTPQYLALALIVMGFALGLNFSASVAEGWVRKRRRA